MTAHGHSDGPQRPLSNDGGLLYLSALNAPGPVHASCVAVDGQGALIIGPSGSGKSALALQIMALGGALVADDRVNLSPMVGGVLASCPVPIAGQIEARGVGILAALAHGPAPVKLIIDMGHVQRDRLPDHQQAEVLGARLTVIARVDGPHFPAAIVQYLKGERCA